MQDLALPSQCGQLDKFLFLLFCLIFGVNDCTWLVRTLKTGVWPRTPVTLSAQQREKQDQEKELCYTPLGAAVPRASHHLACHLQGKLRGPRAYTCHQVATAAQADLAQPRNSCQKQKGLPILKRKRKQRRNSLVSVKLNTSSKTSEVYAPRKCKIFYKTSELLEQAGGQQQEEDHQDKEEFLQGSKSTQENEVHLQRQTQLDLMHLDQRDSSQSGEIIEVTYMSFSKNTY
ncbi:hypothetical protein GHT09_006002 [Marmota monax]|uniref:Uncharacterized protein n=1 Tax=Marmota monax TaxID=9995 RepID=A0A834QR46_MARMO|nr:hypothetical protein GHT09_006002 [Marmota monax]